MYIWNQISGNTCRAGRQEARPAARRPNRKVSQSPSKAMLRIRKVTWTRRKCKMTEVSRAAKLWFAGTSQAWDAMRLITRARYNNILKKRPILEHLYQVLPESSRGQNTITQQYWRLQRSLERGYFSREPLVETTKYVNVNVGYYAAPLHPWPFRMEYYALLST